MAWPGYANIDNKIVSRIKTMARCLEYKWTEFFHAFSKPPSFVAGSIAAAKSLQISFVNIEKQFWENMIFKPPIQDKLLIFIV